VALLIVCLFRDSEAAHQSTWQSHFIETSSVATQVRSLVCLQNFVRGFDYITQFPLVGDDHQISEISEMGIYLTSLRCS
jgi:hypothetical protein